MRIVVYMSIIQSLSRESVLVTKLCAFGDLANHNPTPFHIICKGDQQ